MHLRHNADGTSSVMAETYSGEGTEVLRLPRDIALTLKHEEWRPIETRVQVAPKAFVEPVIDANSKQITEYRYVEAGSPMYIYLGKAAVCVQPDVVKNAQ